MDRRHNNAPAFQRRPLFALADFLLRYIRAILVFFFDGTKRQNLEKLVGWLRLQFRNHITASVENALQMVLRSELLFQLNRYLGGLLRFRTGNGGRSMYVDCLVDTPDIEEARLEIEEDVRREIPRIDRPIAENRERMTTEYYEDISPPTREPVPEPVESFDQKMARNLNSAATYVGPARRFGPSLVPREEPATDYFMADVPSTSSSFPDWPALSNPPPHCSRQPDPSASNSSHTLPPRTQCAERVQTPLTESDVTLEYDQFSEDDEPTLGDDLESLTPIRENIPPLQNVPMDSQRAPRNADIRDNNANDSEKTIPHNQSDSESYEILSEFRSVSALILPKELMEGVYKSLNTDDVPEKSHDQQAEFIMGKLFPKRSPLTNASMYRTGDNKVLGFQNSDTHKIWLTPIENQVIFLNGKLVACEPRKLGICEICASYKFSNHETLRCDCCKRVFHAKCFAVRAQRKGKCICRARICPGKNPYL
ncbi:unnamed protein product [Caenorhabditis nigoni]